MKTVLIIVVLAIVIGGGYYLYQRGGYQATPGETPWPTPAPSATPPATTSGQTHQVVMDATGFVPAELSIKVGDKVTFVNRDTRSRWPASGLHPTHMLCAGFDALQPLAANESYSHVFTETKECPMHDHLTTSIRGKITVTE
ncbi:MAG: hypothetical protein Q8R35_01550 [bacterium]|nr:hypothetical protein [bacterium]